MILSILDTDTTTDTGYLRMSPPLAKHRPNRSPSNRYTAHYCKQVEFVEVRNQARNIVPVSGQPSLPRSLHKIVAGIPLAAIGEDRAWSVCPFCKGLPPIATAGN